MKRGMAETTNEDSGAGRSVEENSNGQRSQSAEALAEWRSSDQVESGTPSTSPPYWDIDDHDDFGSKPSELYGKNTWKIEKFSEINKRELRGDVFEVGGYKWYILIYPQGCDVCNHVSLFLCVANHDKLLPGWSHFAQFTIAVVNKDPKKSKHSDTLHRFWKKEHDWGWKKFIELPKLQEGYISDSDSLIIKAQVQVIRERVDRPFRCLSCQYRRELVRVYLSNVEEICWRFVQEKRSKFGRLIEDKAKWKSFGAFWLGLDQNSRRRMSREKTDVILKLAAKLFFIEKEVTSTLVMDSLYSGWKALEGQTKNKKSRPRLTDTEELPAGAAPIVSVDKDMFVLVDDVLLLLERAALEPLPPKETTGSQNRTKEGNAGEEFIKEAAGHDESRLTELGRRTVEILVLAHIYSNKIDVAYQEAIAWRRQEELIREEEEEWLAESEQKAKRGAAEKEKKSKKKQAKQKKNKNRGKEKRKEEKVRSQTEERDIEKEESVRAKAESSAEKPDTLRNLSDVSDSVDSSGDVLQLDSEDRESSSVHWEIDASEIHPPPLGDTSRGRGSSISIANGVAEKKCPSTVDDSSPTCSNESIRSGVANGSYKGNVLNCRSQKWLSNGKTQPGKASDANSLATETEDQPSRHASNPKKQSHSSETRRVGEADVVISRIQEPKSPVERNPVSKDRGMVQTQEKSPAVLSSPRAAPWNLPSVAQAKPENKGVSSVDTVPNRKAISARSPSSDQASPSRDIQVQILKADVQKTTSPKPTAQPAPSMSRPLSAPIILPKQAAPVISAVQTSTTSFARSMSSTGRVGSPTHSQTYIPQSYKHAIVGSYSFDHLSSQLTGTSALPPYSHPSPISVSNQSGFPINVGSWDVSSGGLLWTGGSSSNRDTASATISGNHRMNAYNTPVSTSMRRPDVQIRRPAQSLMTDEFPHLDIINDLLEDEHGLMDNSIYRVPQQPFSNQYSYHGGADLGNSSRTRSYSDDGFHQSYGEYMSRSSSSSSPYGNGQMDGLTHQTQWQMANMDLSLLAMRSQNDAAATYPYFDLDSSNPNLSAGNNGYRDFRPSNGH